MNGLFLRWLLLTIAIILTSYIVDGIHVAGFFSALFAAAVLSILNALIRPMLLIVTLPINIVTFGLFTLVINAALLKMVSWFAPGFHVYGFWSAVFGSLIISLVSWLLNSFVSDRGKIEYIDLKNRRGNIWE